MSSDRVSYSDSLPASVRVPAVVTWNRLEARPRTADFSRSLRAEIRDALWMLSRQWQVGEFKGEDAGSAILVKVGMETTRITRYAVSGQPAVAFDQTLPLETRVEREVVPVDALMRLEMGRQWLRLLNLRVGDNRYGELYRSAYPLDLRVLTVDDAALFSDHELWMMRAAAHSRAMDGASFLAFLIGGGSAASVTSGALSVSAADAGNVNSAAQDFVDFYANLISQPENGAMPWVPERLEYQFAVSAPQSGGGQAVLVAEEYHHGHLDWYSFDVESSRRQLEDAPGAAIDDNVITETKLTFIPTPVRFSGMPNVRWWSFEDGKTHLGAIKADTTDIPQLLLAEFGLIYGNDWMVVPHVVPVGSLCRVTGLVVTNVFGERTLVRAAGRGADDDWQRWTMFNLSVRGSGGQADTRLFVPPAVTGMIESPPIEEIAFVRDEMANMVWAVETTIPNDRLGGKNGYEAATALVALIRQLAAPAPVGAPLLETNALIRYVVQNSVPENWIPFIPVRIVGSNREVQMQRAQMLRTLVAPPVPVEPRGELLRYGLPDGPYHIFEEEIPRAGTIVTRSYQRVRGADGTTHLWLGRRKSTGRGEGSSGLQFDQIRPLDAQE